jgi:branched-subunit amino acid transport system permease
VLRGNLLELQAIAAAVIGGVLPTGGYGSIIGAAFGALIFGMVQQGIFFTGVDTDWFQLFVGAMVLLAVLFNKPDPQARGGGPLMSDTGSTPILEARGVCKYFGHVVALEDITMDVRVRQSSIVLRYIDQTRAAGIGVIFITHNVHHAYLIGDRFTVLERGRNTGMLRHDEISVEQLEKKMAGGKELERLASEFRRAKVAV